MSLRTLLESALTAIATDTTKLFTFTTGSKSGTDLSALNTTDKTSLPAAINAVLAIAQQAQQTAGAQIDDTTASTSKVFSSSKTNSAIAAAVSALVSSSPATLDTLKEIADALGNDPSFATTITTALGNRVRFDAAQTLTAAQTLQARSNIGAIAAADVGDTTTSLVAVYTAAKQ